MASTMTPDARVYIDPDGSQSKAWIRDADGGWLNITDHLAAISIEARAGDVSSVTFTYLSAVSISKADADEMGAACQ